MPAGHYVIDCTLYLLFIPVLLVYKAASVPSSGIER